MYNIIIIFKKSYLKIVLAFKKISKKKYSKLIKKNAEMKHFNYLQPYTSVQKNEKST